MPERVRVPVTLGKVFSQKRGQFLLCLSWRDFFQAIWGDICLRNCFCRYVGDPLRRHFDSTKTRLNTNKRNDLNSACYCHSEGFSTFCQSTCGRLGARSDTTLQVASGFKLTTSSPSFCLLSSYTRLLTRSLFDVVLLFCLFGCFCVAVCFVLVFRVP